MISSVMHNVVLCSGMSTVNTISPLNAIEEKGLNIKSQNILVYCKGMQLAFSLFWLKSLYIFLPPLFYSLYS